MVETTEKASKALYTLLIMTGLLIVMFVPVFNSYKTDLTNAPEAERHAMEAYRLKWLLGALLVVVVGLIVANISAKKKQITGVPCNTRSSFSVCLQYSFT